MHFNNYQQNNADASSSKSIRLDTPKIQQLQDIPYPILPVLSAQLSSSGVFD
jgi:hypothetical protein